MTLNLDLTIPTAMTEQICDPMRVVFMGTPPFARIILQALIKTQGYDVVAVFTQPDRPAGRGKKVVPPDVKLAAMTEGIPVHQPVNFNSDASGINARELLTAYRPHVLVVAAYGLILPQSVLDIPSLMPINVHASLLPRYRGAAPVQRSIMNQDNVTGITIMHMEAGLDTGPILLQKALVIGKDDTAPVLERELAHLGAELLLDSLNRLKNGSLISTPQDPAFASYAHKLKKEESRISLAVPAAQLHATLRGLTPWPGALLSLHRDGKDDLPVRVFPGTFPTLLHKQLEKQLVGSLHVPFPCGQILGFTQQTLLVACTNGHYAFSELQPVGKKIMSAEAFYNGYLSNSPNAYFYCPL